MMRALEPPRLRSKTGDLADCEDELLLTEDFAAVIDGATSQSQRRWDGLSGGQMAAGAVREAIEKLPADIEARHAVEALTDSITRVYREAAARAGDPEFIARLRDDPVERASACVIMFSRHRRQVWIVGDCQALLIRSDRTTEAIQNHKRVDEITSAARALYLEAELRQRRSEAELRRHDTGREFIKPLLAAQRWFQNSAPRCEYSYGIIDGFEVHEDDVRIVPVGEDVIELVLASDGYPALFPTLAETEAYLDRLIRDDPLLYRACKSTKGVPLGGDAFDDCTYLRLSVQH
jgi:glycerophosphoryl diester phosphodiesterase